MKKAILEFCLLAAICSASAQEAGRISLLRESISSILPLADRGFANARSIRSAKSFLDDAEKEESEYGRIKSLPACNKPVQHLCD